MTSPFHTRLRHLLGPFPKASALNASITAVEDCGTYLRKRVEFDAEEGDRIPAFLLVPKNLSRPLPAIYCHHQHGSNWSLGKSETAGLAGDPEQAIGKELAKRGFIVLCPDAITFEERNRSNFTGVHNYSELATRLVKGQTLMAKALHDITVGFNYLETLPEVNPMALGFIGFSYGGRMALWAPAFEKRIRASVSVCGCIRYQDALAHSYGIQMETCIPGITQIGDMEDIVALAEPASVLILAASNDKWSSGARQIEEAARRKFTQGTLKVSSFEGKHEFPQTIRAEAYRFLSDRLN